VTNGTPPDLFTLLAKADANALAERLHHGDLSAAEPLAMVAVRLEALAARVGPIVAKPATGPR